MTETINQRIALYRKLANLTQTEAAEKMGMKCSTYSQMERKGSISAEKLLALSDLFGVTPEMLLFDTRSVSNLPVTEAPTEPKPETQMTFRQTVPYSGTSYGASSFIFTHKEENIVKILRNLPKSDYDDVINYINGKYKDSKNK